MQENTLQFRPKIIKDYQRLSKIANVCQRLSATHQFFVPLLSLRYFRSTIQVKRVLLCRACLNVPLHRVRKRESTR